MLSFISLLLLVIPQTIWAGDYKYAYPQYGGSDGRDGKGQGRSDGYKSRDDKGNKPDKRPNPNDVSSEDDDLICPFITEGTPISGNDPTVPDIDTYNDILESLDDVAFINSVFQDIVDLLSDSQDCFPADTLGGATNYGGLFIRLAWHCAGTFRETDGAGGCAGGRQRFPPEASWMDNVNLDKARALLVPIKEKYGDALSWGDLMVFAGTASIYALGGPVDSICVGRFDEFDGSESDVLGISARPETADPPCLDQGDCNEGNDIIGASTVGLIYVNPEGVNGVPDPAISAPRIREIFGRMGNNDSETVALIGGGHAFGKCHGACPLGAGPNPEEQPLNPWPGLCGTGRGVDTFTSGIEGQWTTFPFRWDNEYFKLLRDDGFDYELITGPGGAYQWRNPNNGLLMLTTDLAFVYDDDFYDIVVNYANDLDALDRQFAAVWDKLTTSGGVFAREAFCIDASELDLDLDEMPIRKNDYRKGGSRNRRSGNRGNDQKRDDGRSGNDYGRAPQRNDYGTPQRYTPRNDGRNDYGSSKGGNNDNGPKGNDDGRHPAPRNDYKMDDASRGYSKYPAPRNDNGAKYDNNPRVIDDRNRRNDDGKQSNPGGRGGNDYGSNAKSGSRPGYGNRGDDNKNDRVYDNRGGDNGRDGKDGGYGNKGGNAGSSKTYSYTSGSSRGGKDGKYSAQNKADNVIMDQPSFESYKSTDYTPFILIGIITLIFNLIAFSLTYACCLNNKHNVQSKVYQQ